MGMKRGIHIHIIDPYYSPLSYRTHPTLLSAAQVAFGVL